MRYRVLTLLVLALCLVAVLAACGGKGGGGY
jgi:predicted small lipoprotein YifL